MTPENLQEVYGAVFDGFETFREQDVGANLAYLLGAMLDRLTGADPLAVVDWSHDIVGDDGWRMWSVLKRDLPADHPVFSCIMSEVGEPEAAGPCA